MRTYILLFSILLAASACSDSTRVRSSDSSSGTDALSATDAVDGMDQNDSQSGADATDGSSVTDALDGLDVSDSTSAADGTSGGDGADMTTSSDGLDMADTMDANDSSDGVTGVASPLVDPNCVDGQWSEQLPLTAANLSPAINSYSANTATEFILQALSIRYPTGQWIVEGGLQSDAFGGTNCIDAFLGNKSSAGAVIGQLSTIVHECGHFFDLDQGGFFDSAYMLTPTMVNTCSGASYQGSDATFARSLIKNDEYNALRPPCGGSFVPGCDSYADIYLNGDPNDSNFDSGDQAFNMLHEETTQYVNSIATGYAFSDQYQFTVSERDGILTFLWYTCRYLRMARLQYPGSYSVLTQSPCWREAILRVWGRAWLFLEATKDMQNLGISDDEIETLLTEELLQEIQLVRDAHGC